MKKVAILGYGGRGYHYAKMCRQMDKDFQIVAVIDNSEDKRRLAKETAKLDDAQLFSSLDVFLAAPKPQIGFSYARRIKITESTL